MTAILNTINMGVTLIWIMNMSPQSKKPVYHVTPQSTYVL